MAISVYVPFWPGRFIPRESGVALNDSPPAELEKGAERAEKEQKRVKGVGKV